MDRSFGKKVRFKIGDSLHIGILVDCDARGTYRVRLNSGKEVLKKEVEVIEKRSSQRGLLDLAIEILRVRNEPLTTLELIKIIQEGKIWEPCRQGKTPRLTLYSMLYNEAFYKELPRVGKDRRGRWVYINYCRHKEARHLP